MIPHTRLDTSVSRRSMLKSAMAATGTVAALAVVGCGDSDDDAEPATTAPASGSTAPAPPAQTEVATIAAWTQVLAAGATPAPRRDHSMTAGLDGSVWLFGGRAEGLSSDELWRLDPAVPAWTQISPAGESPPARFGHNAFWDTGGDRLVVALGQADATTFFNDVWAFDPAASSWSRVDAGSPEQPAARYGSGGAHSVDTGVILVSHGFTDTGRFDDTWNFALAGGEWAKIATTGTPPVKRCLTRAVWVPARKEMLLFGGQTDSQPFLGDFWAMSDGGAWTERTPDVLPGARNLYGATLDDSWRRWYIVGGNTPDGPTDETWVYDVAEDAWSPLQTDPASPLPARSATDASIARGTLYVFGGRGESGELDDLWALTLA